MSVSPCFVVHIMGVSPYVSFGDGSAPNSNRIACRNLLFRKQSLRTDNSAETKVQMGVVTGFGPAAADAATSAGASVTRRRSEHPFFVGSAIFALVLSLAGFLPGIVDPSRRNGPMSVLVMVHGLSMLGWLVLYLTQTILAATGRLANHRRHGLLAVVLMTVAVVSGIFATLEATRRGADLSGDLVRWSGQPDFVAAMILPFGDILVFGVFVTAALLYRLRPEAHKRLMYFAIVAGFLSAPLVHIIGHFAAPPAIMWTIVALLVASGIHDKVVRGRVHPVSWIAPPLIVASNLARSILLSSTNVWSDLVGWWGAVRGG
jgi:hypothetical protein